MDILLLVIIVLAVGVIIYLLVNQKSDSGNKEELVKVMERLAKLNLLMI